VNYKLQEAREGKQGKEKLHTHRSFRKSVSMMIIIIIVSL